MRIALLLESDGPGGAERMLLTLARELRARGHDIVPIGPAEGAGWLGEQFRQIDLVPETFRLKRAVDPGCATRLGRVLKDREIEIAHSHDFSMAVYGAAAARLARIPHVVTMHGGLYFKSAWRRRAALRWAIRSSAYTVAVARATALQLEASLGLGAGSVRVVPNGQQLARGTGEHVRRALGVGTSERLIVSVGNLYPVKGHDLLIRALGWLSQERPDRPVRLAIAGRGQAEESLRALAREVGVGDRLHFLGYRQDIPDILDAADIFVLPSRSEGLPLALLEAMFAGKPIVATSVGGVPEAIHHREHGLLVPPNSFQEIALAIAEILGNPELGHRVGRAAQDRALRFYSPHSMATAYEELYLSALSTARGPFAGRR